MINIEIEELRGVKKALPKMYLGTAVGGYKICVIYSNHLLEVRVSKEGDPCSAGLIIISKRVSAAPPHDIADVRMLEVLERSGCSFKGRPRILAFK